MKKSRKKKRGRENKKNCISKTCVALSVYVKVVFICFSFFLGAEKKSLVAEIKIKGKKNDFISLTKAVNQRV